MQQALDSGALAAAGMLDGTSNIVRQVTANNFVAANLETGRGIVAVSLVIVSNFTASNRIALAGEIRIETIIGKSISSEF